MRWARFLVVVTVGLALLATAGPAGADIEAEPVHTGLDFPAAFTFGPGGRIFYGERSSGEIRIFNTKTGTDRLFFDVPNLVSDGERGLLGLALHPDYPDPAYVYAYVTRSLSGEVRNQIIRLTNSGGKGTAMRVIFSTDVANSFHVGGRIMFGPDGRLYAVVGEAGSPSNSQDLGNPAGKVLRMTALGKAVPGNPFDNRIYAYGIRNSFGFTFDPRTGRLWETENGPECNDELNRIVVGRNYGWGPSETCSTPPPPPKNTNRDGPNPDLPEAYYTPVIAPTGAAFCDRCGLGPGNNGRLFFGAYKTGEIRRVRLGPKRLGIRSQRVIYEHGGSVLSVEAGPGGRLYFSDGTAIYRLVSA